MSYIIAIIAPSRSGKDTLASMLPGKNIKFSSPMKRVLEEWGGLPEGALEQDEYRNAELPFTPGKTYLDALIATYHFFLDYAPLLPKAPVIKEMKYLLKWKKPIICTDIRMMEEAQLIVDLKAPIFTVRLSREGSEGESSDGKAEEILALLKQHSIDDFEFDNSGTKAELSGFAFSLKRQIDNVQKSFTWETTTA